MANDEFEDIEDEIEDGDDDLGAAKKSKKTSSDDGVEHVPVVPKNEDLEKQKAEARKRAEELRKESFGLESIVITSDGVAKKASELTRLEKEIEIAKCAANPIYFIETYLKIFDQTQGDGGLIVPFKMFDFQKDLVRAYQEFQLNIANKYRQAGISTCTSAFIAWYIAFNSNRNVAIVADKLETARDEMMKDVVDFLEGCPEWLVPQPTIKNNQKHKHYSNDCQLRAFATGGLRGYTPTLLFWDETAWAENGEKFWTAARPAVLNTGGKAIFVSTPNGLDPIFYKTFDAARRGKSKFNAVELWWYNDPRYNVYRAKNDPDGEYISKYGHYDEFQLDLVWIKNKGKANEEFLRDEGWSKQKRSQLADEGWEATSSWFEMQIAEYNGDTKKLAQELLCSFLGSGDNFIAEEFLLRIKEQELMTPIRQEYIDNEMWIFEDPDPSAIYIQSIDVSAGHGDDYSTVNIYRIEESVEIKNINKNGVIKEKKVKRHRAIQVAEYYNKIRPQTLGEIAYTYGQRYNNAYTIIDVTNGYGAITLEKLLELGYDNIHYGEITHKPTRDRLNGYIKVSQKTLPDGKMSKVDLVPGFFLGSNRASVLIELQRSINMSDVVIRSYRLYNELQTFVTVKGNRVADHKRSFHDDSIFSTAMALYSLYHELFKIGESKNKTLKMLDAYMRLGHNDIVEKVNKPVNDPTNQNTRTPDFRVTKNNPYGANAWLFKGLKKR